MSAAIARSFHGPTVSVPTSYRSPAARPPREARSSAGQERLLQPVPAPPSESSVGRALLVAARREQPTAADRERILASVLAALRVLTGGV